MDFRPSRDAMIAIELDGDMVVVVYCVFKLDVFQFLDVLHILRIEVRARRHGGLLDETVGHGLAQAVAVDHILEFRRIRATADRQLIFCLTPGGGSHSQKSRN